MSQVPPMLLSGPSYRTPALGCEKERRIHVRFRVPYHTSWGQDLVITGTGALLGNMKYDKGVTMKCHHEKDVLVWEALVSLPWQHKYSYKFAVVSHKEGGLVVEKEESICHTLHLHESLGHGEVVEIVDTWLDRSYPGSILATAAFTQVIRQHKVMSEGGQPQRLAPAVGEAIVRFKVMDWMLEDNQVLCVTGAIPQLGMWQQDQMLELTETETPCWEGEIRVPYSAFAFTYKYAVVTRAPKPQGSAAAAATSDGTTTSTTGPAAVGASSSSGSSGGGSGTAYAAMVRDAALAAAAAAASHHVNAAGGSGNSSLPLGLAPGASPPAAPVAPASAQQYFLQQMGFPAMNGGVVTVPLPPELRAPQDTAAGPAGAAVGADGRGELHSAVQQQQQQSQHGAARSVLLEVGEPHVCSLPPPSGSSAVGAPTLVVRHDGFMRRDKLWRGAGVALPVFSLRTKDSCGVGEFLDLMKMVDLADASGMRLIQVLPVNDTSVYGTWWDSYPYSTVSVHALHPQYLALRATLEDLGEDMPPDIQQEIQSAQQQLDGPVVDYVGVMAAKTRIARRIFDAAGHKILTTPEYQDWFAGAKGWLQPYAAFCFLKGLFGTAEHWKWGGMAAADEGLVERLTGEEQEWYGSISCCYWVQYQLHRQLRQVSEYAAAHRVVLKGDLPIGVDKRSVDTWMEPRLFRMDKSTGAPPDMFDPKGQNWGFPTYNWEEMAKDGYGWWKRRLGHMAQYFHAYRIDHILGFCRIWEVPGHCATGLMGYFRPSIPLTSQELAARGCKDLKRLTEPYIRRAQLESAFEGREGLMADVAAKYLVEGEPGKYKLRKEYATEKAIASISVRADSPSWLLDEVAATRKGLMELAQNVVLIRDPDDPERLYPRFALTSTSSFRDLDPQQRQALSDLHDDYYFRRQDGLWRNHALATLPALMAASDMLICGEDLGFVPSCLPPVMQELGLIGLRIQRMPSQPGVEFNNPASYPYLTVASPSCHDVTPLRAWWEEDAERRERFYYTTLGVGGPPPDACTPDVASLIIQQHLNCPSAWVILPIQDVFALTARYSGRPAQDEVINDPTVTKHYWRYRMHVGVEDMVEDEELVTLLQDLLLLSDRAKPSDLPQLDCEEAM